MTTVGLPDPRASAAERVGAPLLERYEAEVLGRRVASIEDALSVLAWARRQPTERATRLTCHAPHPDPKKASSSCSATLCLTVPGVYTFVGLVARMPEQPDGYVYHPCPRRSCGQINKFHAVTSR